VRRALILVPIVAAALVIAACGTGDVSVTSSEDEAGAVLSAGMLSFLNDSRRMRNDRLLKELGIVLRYPDLDSGLAACFGEQAGTGAAPE